MKKLRISCLASVAVVTALMSGCGGGDDGIGQAVSFLVIDRDQASGIQTQRFLLVRSATDFSTLWTEHKINDRRPPPTIDFSQNMAVGVFLGFRQSGCYSVAIKSVVQLEDKIVVQYKEEVPSSGACGGALGFPSEIATIPVSNMTVEFTAVK